MRMRTPSCDLLHAGAGFRQRRALAPTATNQDRDGGSRTRLVFLQSTRTHNTATAESSVVSEWS